MLYTRPPTPYRPASLAPLNPPSTYIVGNDAERLRFALEMVTEAATLTEVHKIAKKALRIK